MLTTKTQYSINIQISSIILIMSFNDFCAKLEVTISAQLSLFLLPFPLLAWRKQNVNFSYFHFTTSIAILILFLLIFFIQ